MQLLKLLTNEEEETISTTKLIAIEIPAKDTDKYKAYVNKNDIPSFVKLIKKITPNINQLLLGKINQSDLPSILVEIPIKKPISNSQINFCLNLWPCIYQIKKPTFINELYVFNTFNLILNPNLKFCSGYCLIRNESKIFCLEFDSDNLLGHSIFKAVEFTSKLNINYLCTGLDAFVYEEPCLSCSMVFVHGRIKRVFVINKGSGSFSVSKVNYNKNTNHRYEVFFLN